MKISFRSVLKVAAVALFVGAFGGGCSLFVPHTQNISVAGQPEGALLDINGKLLVSPCAQDVKRNEKLDIYVFRSGYYPEDMHSGYSVSTTGFLDMAGAYFVVFPAIGFLSPGAFSLDKRDFNYTLRALPEAPAHPSGK